MKKLEEETYQTIYGKLKDYPFVDAVLYAYPKDRIPKDVTLLETYCEYNRNGKARGLYFVDQIRYVLEHKDDKGFYTQIDETRPFVGFFTLKTDKPKKGDVIISPGGGYCTVCGLDEGFGVARELMDMGYDCYILKYGIGKEAAFPKAEDDLAHLISYLYQNKTIGNKGYELMGFSASGHQVGLFGSKKYGYAHYGLTKPNHLVLTYPVISLCEDTHFWTMQMVLAENVLRATELSVQENVDEDYPPVYLTRGFKDNGVSTLNSDYMEMALRKKNIHHIYAIQNCDFHGFGSGYATLAAGWLKDVDLFFQDKI